MKNLGGWSRIWIVFAGLWVSITAILFYLNYPSVRSTHAYLSDQMGTYWALSTLEARRLLELRLEHPDLFNDEADEHALASQLISAKLNDEIFKLEIEHQAFVTVLDRANQRTNTPKINKPAIATLTITSPADEPTFKNRLINEFPSQSDAWLQATAQKVTIEAKEIEKRWPKRLSKALTDAKRQKRNFLIGAGVFIFIPPLLLLIAIALMRWVYQGFKSSPEGN